MGDSILRAWFTHPAADLTATMTATPATNRKRQRPWARTPCGDSGLRPAEKRNSARQDIAATECSRKPRPSSPAGCNSLPFSSIHQGSRTRPDLRHERPRTLGKPTRSTSEPANPAEGPQPNTGAFLGTTRNAPGRTPSASAHSARDRHSPADRSKRLDPCPGGQGVAGSNPAVPAGSLTFSNIFLPSPEPANSHLPREMALPEAAPNVCHGVLPGHLPRRQSQESRSVKGPKTTEPPRTGTATPPTANPADTIPGRTG